MLKILIGARQSGATTKLLEMIEKDLENGLNVGVYGEFNSIKDKIKNKKANEHLFHLYGIPKNNALDKVYIFNILKIEESILGILEKRFGEIWCDKPYPFTPIKKVEFDLAREYRYGSVIPIEHLKIMSGVGVDICLMLKYMESPLTRENVEFVRCETSIGIISKLKMLEARDNISDNLFGILFQ